jgi:hypothetical protein
MRLSSSVFFAYLLPQLSRQVKSIGEGLYSRERYGDASARACCDGGVRRTLAASRVSTRQSDCDRAILQVVLLAAIDHYLLGLAGNVAGVIVEV